MKGQDCAEDSQGEENKIYKPRKPPDADHRQRRHQMEVEGINNLIREKEAIYKSLSPTRSEKPAQSMGNREENLSKLRSLKSEKDKRLKRKQVIDAELRDLSQQLQKKTETCTKLQASVRYKDEQKTNDAIKQLEKHLSTHQLKLLEEKKLVSEIDALKRSKKTLSEYLSVKRDVDHLRQMQGSLRHERDILIRETHEIRANENGIKTFLDKQKTESKDGEGNDEPTYDKDTLKKEIDSLYETRRELHGLYKQKMAFSRDEQKKMEKNNIKRKAVEKREEVRISKIPPEKHRQETRPEIHPFEEEKRVCANLLQFLESQRSQPLSEQVEGKVAIPNRFFEGPKSEFKSGSFVMKKSNDDLDGLFATSSHKISRKGSKKGRKSKDLSQKLGLHPHVLEQFVRLNLHPPSTLADVAKVLEQLKEKMDMYEKATIKIKPQLSIPEMSATTSEKQSHTLEIIADKVHANIAETERNTCSKMRDSGGQDTDGKRDSSNVAAELGAGSESGIPETLVIERGTYCEIKDGKDGDAVPSSLTQTSGAFSAATEVKTGVKTVDVGSLGISKTSEISTTHEDMHGIYCEQSGKNVFFSKIEPNILQDEKQMEEKQILEVDEEKNTEYKEILQEDELIKNKANSDGIISKKTKSVDCPYDVIAETIEKNLESFGMNESSKEIQVKVT